MSNSKSVVIVGGGIVGLCSAYYALLAGHRVKVLERGEPSHDSCSLGNAGMIVPSHFTPLAAPGMVALGLKWMWSPSSPFYIEPRIERRLFRWAWHFWRAANAQHVKRSAPLLRDLSLMSRLAYLELAQQHGWDFGLVTKGLLMLCQEMHALNDEARTADAARELGIPAEILDAGQTSQLDPGVTMKSVGSVYFPLDCHLQPQRLMRRLTDAIVAMGGEIHWSTLVQSWTSMGGLVQKVNTTRGVFEADEFVLSAGAWSEMIGRKRGLTLDLPMQAGKGYSLTLEKPRQSPTVCAIFTEARIAVTPMGSSLRFGGTMEIAGFSEKITPRRVKGITRAVPRYYPEFNQSDFMGVPVWRGLRPCSPDGLPYLGRSRKYQNMIVATGHAMMGLSLGPITGKLVAQLVDGTTPEIDLRLLSPDRFS